MPLSKNITPFDTSQVNAVLRAIVNETPAGTRYVNPYGLLASGHGEQCYYVDRSGNGSCLVGRVAERLGIPLPKWGSGANQDSIDESGHFREFFTPDAIQRLQTVQTRQDEGETWRRAIR